MIEFEPVVWVAWEDGKLKRRGPVRGYAPQGRRRKIHAVVQAKDRLIAVGLDDLRVVRAPKRKG